MGEDLGFGWWHRHDRIVRSGPPWLNPAMKLTSTLDTLLVAALIVSDGEEDRRMTVNLVSRLGA